MRAFRAWAAAAYGRVELVQLVRTFGLSTYVEDGAHCASACFLVFAAGKQKFASYGARIGVYAGKDPTGDADRAAAGTDAMHHLLTALGVPPSSLPPPRGRSHASHSGD